MCENQKGTPWECGFSLHSATMVLSLLCNHLQFLLGFSAMAKQTKIKKTKKWQDPPPSATIYSPLGVCNLVFFCIFVFWVFCFCCFGFLVFCFFLSGPLLFFWRAKDLDLTLCQFSHFRGCKLAFGWFYYLLWACGSIRKQCTKLWQNAGITGGSLGGVGTQIRQFCLFM